MWSKWWNLDSMLCYVQELRESRVTLLWGLDAHDDAITTLSVVSEPKGILSGTPHLPHTLHKPSYGSFSLVLSVQTAVMNPSPHDAYGPYCS